MSTLTKATPTPVILAPSGGIAPLTLPSTTSADVRTFCAVAAAIIRQAQAERKDLTLLKFA